MMFFVQYNTTGNLLPILFLFLLSGPSHPNNNGTPKPQRGMIAGTPARPVCFPTVSLRRWIIVHDAPKPERATGPVRTVRFPNWSPSWAVVVAGPPPVVDRRDTVYSRSAMFETTNGDCLYQAVQVTAKGRSDESAGTDTALRNGVERVECSGGVMVAGGGSCDRDGNPKGRRPAGLGEMTARPEGVARGKEEEGTG
jgi:hypothetical protein